MRVVLLFFVFLFGLVDGVVAAPQFAEIFQSHAVLQRDRPIVVWGFGANADSDIRLSLGDEEIVPEVLPGGKWVATFPGRGASSEPQRMLLFDGGSKIAQLNDILIGDVWLAAGQSNMQYRVSAMVKGLPETKTFIDAVKAPEIRFRRIDDPVAAEPGGTPLDLSPGAGWVPMTPESVGGFSAVATVFAREVNAITKVPVGIIDVSWGGKPIEPFIPLESFTTPLLEKIKLLAGEGRIEELAVQRGGVVIRNPEGHPGAIFDARIRPVVSFGLKGFLWYQAESNAGKGEDPREYRQKMEALVSGWRMQWKDETLPFHFVQLPSYPSFGWIRAREEQRLALAIPHSGMVVTIDIPGDDIHPPDKISVGRRLARSVLKNESGPLYRRHKVREEVVYVSFDHADDGLMVGRKTGIAPVKEADSFVKLQWFELAGPDGKWYSATAVIEGEQVRVMSKFVSEPTEVRYACDVAPRGGNLYGSNGLPASPFCSDLNLLPREQN